MLTLVGAFSVIVQPVVEPMDRFAALIMILSVEHDGGQQPRHPRHVLLRRVQPPDRQAHVARHRGLRVQQQALHPGARPQLV